MTNVICHASKVMKDCTDSFIAKDEKAIAAE
jgi:hypothetical protein